MYIVNHLKTTAPLVLRDTTDLVKKELVGRFQKSNNHSIEFLELKSMSSIMRTTSPDAEESYYILEGNCLITKDNLEFKVSKGACIFIEKTDIINIETDMVGAKLLLICVPARILESEFKEDVSDDL